VAAGGSNWRRFGAWTLSGAWHFEFGTTGDAEDETKTIDHQE
jgi:hypothetical protein